MPNYIRNRVKGGCYFLIKTKFSKGLSKIEGRSSTRIKRGERGIWQRRFWEHTIRGEEDYGNHMDYLHYNPAKHGHVSRVVDWPYSSFHRLIKCEVYDSVRGNEALNLEVGEPG